MKLVIVESPFAGDNLKDRARNRAYARACLLDSLHRGEAPFASHLLYTQPGVLDDDFPPDRDLGILAGLAWADKADLTAVYTDLGISRGMNMGLNHARTCGRPIEARSLGGQWVKEEDAA